MTGRPEPPALTAALLARLVAEAHGIVGLEVRNVAAVAGDGVLFRLGAAGEKELRARWLVVTASGRARAHLVAPHRGERTEADPETAAFAARLGAAIEGATIEDLIAVPGERVIHARLRLRSGAPATLAGELFGATPNLALVDATGIVRVCRRTRAGSTPLSVGAPYRAPQRRTGHAAEPLSDPPPIAPTDFGTGAGLPPLTAHVATEYALLDRDAAAFAIARNLGGRVRGELARIARRIEDLIRDRDAALDAPRERELADLLAANFARLRAGLSTIEVDDLYRGGRVELALDPALPPHENVARRYRRVEKLERSLPHVTARLDAARDLHHRLEVAARTCELAARDATRLADARSAAAEAGIGERSRVAEPTRGSPSAHDPGIRRFVSHLGASILVGKDDADNDRLTHRIAKANDIWLHIEGFPGSHVVLRVERGKNASLDDLLDAARLAVHFSKRRGAARATVTYTPRKYVRKGRGKPGLAIVERGKTLVIDHDPVRLADLLAGHDVQRSDS